MADRVPGRVGVVGFGLLRYKVKGGFSRPQGVGLVVGDRRRRGCGVDVGNFGTYSELL